MTTWNVNRNAWAFGLQTYRNPFVVGGTTIVDNRVFNYSQPIVLLPEERTLAGNPNDVAPAPGISPEAVDVFERARQEFYAGRFDLALEWVDAAIADMPNDAVLHEFRALTLFALGRYQESAATLYPVLSAGPGWDWTTMIGLYSSVDEYTRQLRALEAFRNEHPDDVAARFVLAYQYITAGHTNEAIVELQALLRIDPSVELAAWLLLDLDPDAQVPSPPQFVEPPQPSSPIEPAQLQGVWTATRDDGTKFEMTLEGNDEFRWSFGKGDESNLVTGLWVVDDDGVLALEMNDGSVMLAQLNQPDARQLDFYMLGDTRGTAPLRFQRQ